MARSPDTNECFHPTEVPRPPGDQVHQFMMLGARRPCRGHLLRRYRHHRGRADRRARTVQERRPSTASKPLRGQVPPGRRLHLPGPRRGPSRAPDLAGHALAHRCSRAAPRAPWPRGSPARCSTRPTAAAARSRSERTRTRWRRPTRPSRTTAGSARRLERGQGDPLFACPARTR